VFGESRLRTDEPLGIDRDAKLLAGIGGQYLHSAEQSLSLELGVGARSIEFDASDDAFTDTLGIARMTYFRTLFDAVRLDVQASVSESSEDISERNSEIGLSLRIPSGTVRVAYRDRYLKVGDADAISDGDTFVSLGVGF